MNYQKDNYYDRSRYRDQGIETTTTTSRMIAVEFICLLEIVIGHQTD